MIHSGNFGDLSNIWKSLGQWPVGCVWHPWVDPLASPIFPQPLRALFRDPATAAFPLGNFSGVGSLPRKGSVGSAEAERSWMNKQVLNLTLSNAFPILLIQTFLRGSNYMSSKLILSGCCGKDETL